MAAAAAEKTIGDKPVLDGVPDPVCEAGADDMEDADGVHGVGVVVEPTSLASGLGIV